jgi:hypothetical protein
VAIHDKKWQPIVMKDSKILKVPTSSKFRIVKNSVIKFIVGVVSDLLVCHIRYPLPGIRG